MKRRIRGWLLVIALLCGWVALLYVGPQSEIQPSTESRVFEVGTELLLANTTTGRQALVSSMWWPPLPFLLRAPLQGAVPFAPPGWVSLLLSSGLSMVVFFMVHEALREWGFGVERVAITLAIFGAPAFLTASLDGSSVTLVAVCVLGLAHGLSRWFASRRLRELVLFGFSAAGLLVSAPEGLPCALGALLLFGVVELCRRGPLVQKNAALCIALLPSVYVALLWVLICWLLMGDAFYAFRALSGLALDWSAGLTGLAQLDAAVLWLGLPAIAAIGVAALRRDTTGAVLGGLLVFLTLFYALGSGSGIPWSGPLLVGALAPLAVLVMARVLHPVDRGRFGLRMLGLVAAVLFSAVAYMQQLGVAVQGPSVALDADARAEIEAHATARSPFAKVFVCGYEGLGLVGSREGHVFRHALDFNFNTTKDDYRGHAMFILVPKPQGRNSVESVHRLYPSLYGLGWKDTLYDRDWGSWRLFELIEARRPARKASE